MNYYEHHIGDFDSATAHLSLVEDAVYRRLICLYYRSEAPIPADVKQACRLVRAVTKAERDTVADVLREFFTLEADGWRNSRCDEEIARYRESEPDREAKRENERERQRRTRERRRELFDLLRSHGVVPAYDAPMSELQAAASRLPSQPVTLPVTRDDTATHTPDTRHQYSVPDGTGAKAPPPTPPNDRDAVFAVGLTLLTAAGVEDRHARSFLAQQSKAHGDAALLAALQRCADERPVQPVPWLVAALKTAPAKPGKSKFIADREAQASRWIGTAKLPGMGGEVIDAQEAQHGAAPAIR